MKPLFDSSNYNKHIIFLTHMAEGEGRGILDHATINRARHIATIIVLVITAKQIGAIAAPTATNTTTNNTSHIYSYKKY